MEKLDLEHIRLVGKRFESEHCHPNWTRAALAGKTPEEVAGIYQSTLEAHTHIHRVFTAQSMRAENTDGELDHEPAVSSASTFI